MDGNQSVVSALPVSCHRQISNGNLKDTLEFFLNVSLNSVTKNICHYSKLLELAISCVRDQHATTALARHMLETGSLN